VTRGYKLTQTLRPPPADAVPETGTAHIVGGSSILDQAAAVVPANVAAGAPPVEAGAPVSFAVALRVPPKVPNTFYVPTNVSVALVEFNASTTASGVHLEIHTFAGFDHPGEDNTTFTWNSREVLLHIGSSCLSSCMQMSCSSCLADGVR
jgi:hypothetical protein